MGTTVRDPVITLRQPVNRWIRRLGPGLIGVACSGGADSMALADAGERGCGDVARCKPITGRYRRNDFWRRKSADQHCIAVKQAPQLNAGAARDFIFSAARQEIPRKAGDRGIPVRVDFSQASLRANPRCKPTGDQRDDQ